MVSSARSAASGCGRGRSGRPFVIQRLPRIFSELLLESLQLEIGRLVPCGPIGLVLQQFVVEVQLGTGPAGSLEVAPRRVDAGGHPRITEAAAGLLEPRRERPTLALRQHDLISLHGELPFQHRHPFPVAVGKLSRHPDRLRIGDLRREGPTAFRIGQLPALDRKLTLGGLAGPAQVVQTDLPLQQRLPQRGRSLARCLWHGGSVDHPVEPVAETREESHGCAREMGVKVSRPNVIPPKPARQAPVGPRVSGTVILHGASLTGGPLRRALLLLVVLAGCAHPAGGGVTCGLAAVFGPLAILGEFSTPGQTLATPPAALPGKLPVRLVAGPALPAVVGRDHAKWLIGVIGAPPPKFRAGYGVLVEDTTLQALGIVVYEGEVVRGAPVIGSVILADSTVPLIGVSLLPSRVEDARCPIFPDSTLQ